MENPGDTSPEVVTGVESKHVSQHVPGEGPGPITIRPMVADDCAFGAKMFVNAFYSKFAHAVGEENIEKVICGVTRAFQESEDKYHRSFIACYEGEVAGKLQIKFSGEQFKDNNHLFGIELGCWKRLRLRCMISILEEEIKDPNVCYIDHICVDEKFRGKGIGKLLLDRAEYEARRMGRTQMMLWVAQENPACRLYERQGYQVVQVEDGCFVCLWCCVGIRMFCKMEKNLPSLPSPVTHHPTPQILITD